MACASGQSRLSAPSTCRRQGRPGTAAFASATWRRYCLAAWTCCRTVAKGSSASETLVPSRSSSPAGGLLWWTPGMSRPSGPRPPPGIGRSARRPLPSSPHSGGWCTARMRPCDVWR